MNHYLYKMNFTSPLHIGNDMGQGSLSSSEITIHSDTLFSALCTEAVLTGENAAADKFAGLFKKGQAILSDAFPFCGEEYFLPKPVHLKVTDGSAEKDRKLYKKLTHVPLSMYKSYLKCNDNFDVEEAVSMLQNIAVISKRQCVAVHASTEDIEEVPTPYFVGTAEFNSGCGLYVIAGFENDSIKDIIENLFRSLSYSGIGGKRSVGMGRFKLHEPIDIKAAPMLKNLYEMLNNKCAETYITLNTSLPLDGELENALDGAHFTMCKRGGFVSSAPNESINCKKKTKYAFVPGSCFKKTYSGDVFSVNPNGCRRVFRYLKPMFAGVNL